MACKSRALRIAMLGHKRIPSREGGVEVVVTELATRMAKQGHAVTCFNRTGHHVSGSAFDETKKQKEYCGVRLKHVWTVQKKGLAAMTASLFASVLAAFGPYDVVHFHAEGPCATIWLPRLFGKRCIATIHGLDHQRAKWGKLASWYIRTGEKNAVRFAHEIIVLNENEKKYFQETYGRETVFIPNGVNRPEPLEAREIRERFGLEKDSYLLFLGRLVPEKGVAYLIEAFRALDTDKKLVIAGGTSDTDAYVRELYALAKDDPRILFTDFVSGRTLEELYSNAYLYVLPSDLEGMPLSLMEAMSYGALPVTSNIPECTFVLGDHGFTFPRGSVSALRELLARLLADPEAVRTARLPVSSSVCSRFHWDSVTAQTLQLYGSNEP